MKIVELLEVVKNTGKLIDILRNDRGLSREIRQTYNKLRKKKNVDINENRSIKWWAEYLLTTERIKNSSQLQQMLTEIIKLCS